MAIKITPELALYLNGESDLDPVVIDDEIVGWAQKRTPSRDSQGRPIDSRRS